MDISTIIKEALREDLGDKGDVTTDAICAPNDRSKAQIVVKADGVICGLDVVREVFRALDSSITWTPRAKDSCRTSRKERTTWTSPPSSASRWTEERR